MYKSGICDTKPAIFFQTKQSVGAKITTVSIETRVWLSIGDKSGDGLR